MNDNPRNQPRNPLAQVASDSSARLVKAAVAWYPRARGRGERIQSKEAAKRFFAQSREVVGHGPDQVTTDAHDVYPRAIRETLEPEVVHRCSRY
jgi:hypothetical protein